MYRRPAILETQTHLINVAEEQTGRISGPYLDFDAQSDIHERKLACSNFRVASNLGIAFSEVLVLPAGKRAGRMRG